MTNPQELITKIIASLNNEGVLPAYQGCRYEIADKLNQYNQRKDIDIWIAENELEKLDDVMNKFDATRIITSIHKDWLSHIIYITPYNGSYIQIDFTIGRLMVGPFMLHDAKMDVVNYGTLPCLTYTSAVANLILRPLFRGHNPSGLRRIEACEAWDVTPDSLRQKWLTSLTEECGQHISSLSQKILERNQCADKLLRRMKLAILVASFRKLPAYSKQSYRLFKQYLFILLNRQKPFGRPASGTLIVLLGTDGAGKSTVADISCCLFRQAGYKAGIYYLGRGRGNLPGLNMIRNLVSRLFVMKIPPTAHSDIATTGPSYTNTSPSLIYKFGSWYYAFEYLVRTIPIWWYVHIRGYTIVTDRYVYDLGIMPQASRIALSLARLITPKPDLNIFLYAPADLILQRKRERKKDDIDRHNTFYQKVIDANYASYNSITLNSAELTAETIGKHVVNEAFIASHLFYSNRQTT